MNKNMLTFILSFVEMLLKVSEIWLHKKSQRWFLRFYNLVDENM